MTKFHTITGSVYEIHEDTKQIRWSREGKERWISYDGLFPAPIRVGCRVVIFSSNNIMTSKVVKIEE